jgi:hypothetical protein
VELSQLFGPPASEKYWFAAKTPGQPNIKATTTLAIFEDPSRKAKTGFNFRTVRNSPGLAEIFIDRVRIVRWDVVDLGTREQS